MSVLSGSMAPKYQVGDLVFINTNAPIDDISIGGVVTYQSSAESVITHRVVSIDEAKRAFRTKGDANEIEDLSDVSFDQFVGVPFIHIPKAGDILMNLTSPKYIGIGLIFLAVIITLFIVPVLLAPESNQASNPNGKSANLMPQDTREKGMREEQRQP
jgi:signal peptidase I